MQLFFEHGATGDQAHMKICRGFNQNGEQLFLPSDLRAVEPDADSYDEHGALWYSATYRRYWKLVYNTRACEWWGYQLRARSAAAARAELE
ncbi:TPA: hypothetical protein ACJVPN_005307 [Pseudomonas aeruginosa]|uniref:hypothetical protein n=1 Tax=Pseudomonas aeruginosa TaxID=287 RepID=UPI000512FEEC|nr:hypothetical protein D480_0224775 [Pseudomonas aeruginosa]HCT4768190.1 hypothetical protein [Pseudomonas aeruginosa]